jgi:WD40 repeat protein
MYRMTLKKVLDRVRTYLTAMKQSQKHISFAVFSLILFWGYSAASGALPLETVMKTGHADAIRALCFSRDGRFVLTASNDRTAKLWETSTGREIRTFKGHSSGVNSVDSSPDGKFVVTGSSDGSVKLWDAVTGSEVKSLGSSDSYQGFMSFDSYLVSVNSVSFSPDGKYVVIGTNAGVKLWDVKTGSLLRSLSGSMVLSVGFSPDGGYVLAAGADRTARLLNVKTGKEVRVFTGPSNLRPDSKAGSDSGYIYSAAFSPDEKYVVTSGYGAATLWNAQTGMAIRTFEGHSDMIRSLGFSLDGRYLVTGSEDKTVRVWNVATGKEIVSFRDSTHAVRAVGLSPDGKQVVTGNEYGTARLYDVSTGHVIWVSGRGESNTVFCVRFSPDGKHLAVSTKMVLQIWNFKKGKMLRSIDTHSSVSTDFSPSGRLIAVGDGQKATLYDIASGRPIRNFIGHSGAIWSVAFSPSGSCLVTASQDKTAKVWEVATGKLLRNLTGHSADVNSAKFSPDGRYIATGSSDWHSKLWDIRTGREMADCYFSFGDVYSVDFDPRGLYVIAGGRSDATLLDVTTWRPLRTFTGHAHSYGVSSVRFSGDGRYVLTGSGDATARLWDLSTGKTVRTFRGHSDRVSAVDFSPDNRFIVTGSWDGTAKLWKVRSGNESATLFSIGKRDWAVKTREGFFDFSEGANRHVYFVYGLDVIEIEQFFGEFYRPGLLAEVMSDKELKLPKIDVRDRIREYPPPLVEIVSPSEGQRFSTRTIQVVMKVTNNGGGIDGTKLLLNEKRISDTTRGINVLSKDNSIIKIYNVVLVNGDNHLVASAFSNRRVESRGYSLRVFYAGQSKKADAYIFVIGIDKYKNSKYNLNYAKADAVSVAQRIHNKSTQLFKDVYLYHVYNEEATSDRIRAIFETIISKAKPEDVFTFFYAGHGVVLPDDKGDEQFYLVPTEVTGLFDEEKVHKDGISGKHMATYSKDLAAQKQLIILDACQSGSLSDAFALRGAAEEKALAQLARSAGIHLLASTTSQQYASEFKELGHGIFSYVLLKALDGQADGSPKDGKITVNELKAYLDDQVPEITAKYKGEAQYPVIYSKGQDFPVILK